MSPPPTTTIVLDANSTSKSKIKSILPNLKHSDVVKGISGVNGAVVGAPGASGTGATSNPSIDSIADALASTNLQGITAIPTHTILSTTSLPTLPKNDTANPQQGTAPVPAIPTIPAVSTISSIPNIPVTMVRATSPLTEESVSIQGAGVDNVDGVEGVDASLEAGVGVEGGAGPTGPADSAGSTGGGRDGRDGGNSLNIPNSPHNTNNKDLGEGGGEYDQYDIDHGDNTVRDHSGERKPINHVKIPATQHDNRKLFVGGLPTNVSELTFLKFFEQFGEVIDSVVMIDRATRRSRGFGFVTFASEEVARSLLTTIPGRSGTVNIMGKMCEVKASEPKAEGSSSFHNHGGHGHHHGNHGRGGWGKDHHNHHNHHNRTSSPVSGVSGISGSGGGSTGHNDHNSTSPRPYNHHTNHHQNHHHHHHHHNNNKFYALEKDQRDFDELLYPPHGQSYPNIANVANVANYPTMNNYNDYTRNHLTAMPIMYPPSPHGTASVGPGGVGDPYSNSSAWEVAYPGSPSASASEYSTYGTAATGAMPDQGYGTYYAPPPGSQYPMSGTSMMYPPSMGSAMYSSYANYGGYYASAVSAVNAGGAPVSAAPAPMGGGMPMGGYPSDGSLESYPQQPQYAMGNYSGEVYGEPYAGTSSEIYE